jgi:hypothetical protein
MKAIIYMLFALGLISCAGPKDSPPPAPVVCAYVSSQVNNSAGSSIGSNYSFSVGNGFVTFSNLNLTFWVAFGNVIVDVGNVCLADANFWTGASSSSSITTIVGHTYLVRSRTIINGITTYDYSAFVVKSYHDGVINITYATY